MVRALSSQAGQPHPTATLPQRTALSSVPTVTDQGVDQRKLGRLDGRCVAVSAGVRCGDTVDIYFVTVRADAFDLSVFGEPDSDPRPEGTATIIAPLDFGRADQLRWAGRTLTRLARAWTFVDADESDLDQLAP